MGKKKKSSSKGSTTVENIDVKSTSADENNNNNNVVANGTDDGAMFNPLSKLTEQQLQTLKEFSVKVSTLDIKENEKRWMGDKDSVEYNMLLLRYLRARDYDQTQSLTLLKNSLEWRESYQPELLTPDLLSHEISTGKTYVNGKDNLGRPVIYMRPERQNTTNYVKQIQLIVYTIERAIEMMDTLGKGVEQVVIMIDFKGYSLLNAPPMHVSRDTLDILTNQYPERLGMAFVIDPPMIFNIFWKMISPFINPVTSKKIVFVKGEKQRQKVFSQHFDMNQLEDMYGGSSGFEYKHDPVWRNEIIRYRLKNNLPAYTEEEMVNVLNLKE